MPALAYRNLGLQAASAALHFGSPASRIFATASSPRNHRWLTQPAPLPPI